MGRMISPVPGIPVEWIVRYKNHAVVYDTIESLKIINEGGWTMTYFDLNLNLNDEDKAIREAAHKFAKEVMRPMGIELDRMSADDAVAPNSPIWGFLK